MKRINIVLFALIAILATDFCSAGRKKNKRNRTRNHKGNLVIQDGYNCAGNNQYQERQLNAQLRQKHNVQQYLPVKGPTARTLETMKDDLVNLFVAQLYADPTNSQN